MQKIGFNKDILIKIIFYNIFLKIITETEDWVYPEISFIAEFGGALGLFVGFSFYMIWDIAEWLLNKWSIKTEESGANT